MGELTWVHPDTPLPPAHSARRQPNGLLAAGADLSVARLTEAYRQGIFPWFSPGDPVLWWSPDPRMVLVPEKIHLSHSLKKQLRQIKRAQQSGNYSLIVTTDLAFEQVLQGCASRGGQDQSQTWITRDMQTVYQQWHRAGGVHSLEVWVNGQLAGGIYGVCLGRMFFGESMFTRSNNASKIALAHLAIFLARQDVGLIDCQMQTDHLASLGAHTIARERFIEHVAQAVDQPAIAWPAGWLNDQGEIDPDLPDTISLPTSLPTGAIGYDQSP